MVQLHEQLMLQLITNCPLSRLVVHCRKLWMLL
jgi:hypothetical protein